VPRSVRSIAPLVAALVAACAADRPADAIAQTALMTADTSIAAAATVPARATTDASARANGFFEQAYEAQVALDPEKQTVLGRRTNYGRWRDRTDEAANARDALLRRQLETLRRDFPREALDRGTQLSYDLFAEDLERELADVPYRRHQFLFDQMNGMQAEIPAFLVNFHQVNSVADAEAYVARLRGIRKLFAQAIEQADRAASLGILPPKFAFPYVASDARNIVKGRPLDASGEDSTLYADFRAKLAKLALPAAESERLLSDCRAALTGDVRPAYDTLLTAVARWEPKATGNEGAWHLPDGERYYATQLANNTTTSLSADEIHRLGLAEVARIHGAMRGVIGKVGFKGSLEEFFEFMRSDPRFYLPEGEKGRAEYLARATAAIDAARAKLPAYFEVLPRASLTVKAVEAFREQSAGKAFYSEPAADGSRPGIYYVNLYRMHDMPTYELEALAFHEGIPGHHMQIARALEMKQLPLFRRQGEVTAYVEGWALYAETLAGEMGFYQDPYSYFGRLTQELWRASRLVVDTGIHAKHWTREQAIDFLVANTPNPKGQAVKAIERYFVMPGQATAYTVGMLHILELRDRAQKALGPKFDIREFHEAVIGNGPVSLSVLDRLIDEYIARKSGA
jgi:uncharacterized protein (DUF885 family)